MTEEEILKTIDNLNENVLGKIQDILDDRFSSKNDKIKKVIKLISKIKKITRKREKDVVITHVEVDGVVKTKKEVLDDISNNDYYTYPDGIDGKQGAKVQKTKSGHISTNPNDDTKDNLGELKDF